MNAMRGSLGWIEVICGPMFSGKSEELIRRLRRAEIARQRVQIFKPAIDERYSSDHIVSHNDMRIPSIGVSNAAEVQAKLDVLTKTLAICMQCGNPAKHTQRLIASDDLIVVGATGMYEARCRRCFEPNLAADEMQRKKKTELVTAR